MNYIVETTELTKTYGKNKALDNINIHIPKGSIYGLIGRNGAGKTTFLKVITGLAKQTSGNYNMCVTNPGVLIEAPGIHPNFTAMENMMAKCLAMGINDKNVATDLLKLTGLENTGKKKAGNFSLGMKQRLGMAMAFIGKPQLVILDEPINGLDPQGIIEVRDIITKLNKEENITFIISSHILEELSKIATNYGIIEKGRLIDECNSETLLSKCAEKIEINTNNNEKAIEVIKGFGISNVKQSNDGLLNVYGSNDKCAEINTYLVNQGLAVNHLCVSNESLESYYVGLINQKGGNKNA